eukprot:11180229-Karenia_brevis.AAC.1
MASQKLKESEAFCLVTPELALPKVVQFQPLPVFQRINFQPLAYKASPSLVEEYIAAASPIIAGLHKFLSSHRFFQLLDCTHVSEQLAQQSPPCVDVDEFDTVE